jgi:hypothetical protein
MSCRKFGTIPYNNTAQQNIKMSEIAYDKNDLMYDFYNYTAKASAIWFVFKFSIIIQCL